MTNNAPVKVASQSRYEIRLAVCEYIFSKPEHPEHRRHPGRMEKDIFERFGHIPRGDVYDALFTLADAQIIFLTRTGVYRPQCEQTLESAKRFLEGLHQINV